MGDLFAGGALRKPSEHFLGQVFAL
jgi:hypothetical protein